MSANNGSGNFRRGGNQMTYRHTPLPLLPPQHPQYQRQNMPQRQPQQENTSLSGSGQRLGRDQGPHHSPHTGSGYQAGDAVNPLVKTSSPANRDRRPYVLTGVGSWTATWPDPPPNPDSRLERHPYPAELDITSPGPTPNETNASHGQNSRYNPTNAPPYHQNAVPFKMNGGNLGATRGYAMQNYLEDW